MHMCPHFLTTWFLGQQLLKVLDSFLVGLKTLVK